MNKMKFDRDKCQFPDSDPKAQLHTDAGGGVGGWGGEKWLSNEQHMPEKSRELS